MTTGSVCARSSMRTVDDELGCRVTGPEAIFAALKKSLDGFDRRFERRRVALRGLPRPGWNRLTLDWAGTYTTAGWTPLVLEGTSKVLYRQGRIARLSDSFAVGSNEMLRAWSTQNGVDIDPSYV